MNDEQFQSAAGEPGNKAAGQNGGTTALRIFDQANGMNDFPVLKAFQEYIEAEQARARKRTLGLSIFFIVLLVVVVVTFSVIMAAVINRDQQSLQAIATRNQALSDKLLDIALRERTPAAQPVVNVQQPPAAVHPDTGAQALKPVLDRLESLTEALKKQPAGTVPQPVPMVQPAVPQPLPAAVSPELEAARRQQDELARQRAAVAAERARLREEQEQLRRDRIEQHRRRLYPDYYAREDAQKTAAEVPPPPAKKKGTPTALPKPPPAAVVPAKPPVAEPPSVPAPVAKPKPVAQPKPVAKPVSKPAPVAPPPKPKVVEAPAVDLKTAKPISYFDEAEDAPKPTSTSTNIPSPGAVQPDATERVPPIGSPRSDATGRVPPIHQASPLPGGTGSVPSAPTKVLQPPPKKQPSARTEVLNVGTKDGEAIPWLIELPEGGEK